MFSLVILVVELGILGSVIVYRLAGFLCLSLVLGDFGFPPIFALPSNIALWSHHDRLKLCRWVNALPHEIVRPIVVLAIHPLESCTSARAIETLVNRGRSVVGFAHEDAIDEVSSAHTSVPKVTFRASSVF